MTSAPMRNLAELATTLARTDTERRAVWHRLVGGKHWLIILIRHTRKGTPPEKPAPPAVRINPEFLRKVGIGLTPEALLHERIIRHLRALAQGAPEISLAEAAAAATDVAIEVLAELGVTVADLPIPEETTTNG